MRRAKAVFDEVRAAQELLGTGQVEEAFAAAAALREESTRLVAAGARLTSFERTYAGAALTYSTVTMVLAHAEKDPPPVSVPAMRRLARDICGVRAPGVESWKVLAAAAEMLARAGDALGASWAAKKAQQLGDGSDYLVRLAGGISSMYPQVFSQIGDEPGDEPPPPPAR